jgi:hypothetical protein
MSEFVGSMLSSFHNHFKLLHDNLVHIEGGLGSQILGAIFFWNLQDKLGKEKARCDLSYFSPEAQSNDLWNYELGKFNIPITEFQKFERNSKRNLLKAKRNFLTADELQDDFWQNARIRYINKFNYDRSKTFAYFKEMAELEPDEPFTAIHIRRGDYLKVASKIITTDDYVKIINVIKDLVVGKVIVVSDSEVSDEDKSKLQNNLGKNELVFLDSPELDPFNTHCLLREAKLLVTANSTYSFSAGLLGRQGQTVFSPMEFHSGQGSEKYNGSFRAAGSFFAWPKRS